MASSPSPLFAAAKAEHQKQNERATIYFATSMGGIMALFIISHIVKVALRYSRPKQNVAVKLTRHIRGFMLREMPGFVSQGHAVVFVTYIATMVILLFVNIDWSATLNVGRRAGWLAVANIALLAFLSLKNTPLALLTAYSYERINIFHQLAGYTTIACMIVHAGIEYDSVPTVVLKNPNIICGMIAGAAMLVILATALFVRKMRYELFYIVHVVLFMAILILIGMHRPDISTNTMIIIIVAAGIWISDRAIRLVRLVYNSYHGHVTITPLSNDGVRVVFAKPTLFNQAQPGSHVFFWIPRIRLAEAHPFTIVSTNPMELVISAHDGFTRDLLSYARNHPGAKLRASIDGPYGTLPDFTVYDQIVMIAGGSGATFTFGVAIDLVRKLSRHPQGAKPILNFIWIVREQDSLSWFTRELEELQASPTINLIIHVTRAESPSTISLADFAYSADPSPAITRVENGPQDRDEEKADCLDPEKESRPAPSPSTKLSTLNLGSTAPSFHFLAKSEYDTGCQPLGVDADTLSLLPGRPDASTLIQDCIAKTDCDGCDGLKRVIVLACGPKGLMTEVRNTVADVVKRNVSTRLTVELHCERFGW